MEHHLKNTYFVADNIVSSLGFTTNENMQAISEYRSGVKLWNDGRIADEPILAGRIDDERLKPLVREYKLESHTRLEQIAIISISEVIRQATVDLQKCKLILSTTKGNIDLLSGSIEQINEDTFLYNTAKRIAEYFNITTKPLVLSNACISGISALIVADRLLQTEKYSEVLVVGIDTLSHFVTSGFRSFKSLSENICRPYDADRDGLNLGEACGTILLSNKSHNNSPILLGGAISNDANHISGPSRTGDGLFLAMQGAMHEANVNASDIDFVNLHGTATVFNDEMESKAIGLAQLNETPTNSLKPYFGHTLGASGIIETIACLYQLKNKTVFGVNTFRSSDTSQPLNISDKHRSIDRSSICLKTASGFGGCNAAIVISTEDRNRNTIANTEFEEIRHCKIENSNIDLDGETVFESDNTEFPTFIREAFKALGESNLKFYKMDDLSKLGYIASAHLLEGIEFAPTEMGIILSNNASSLDTDIRFQKIIDKDGDAAASPAIFVYTLPNIVAGEICIRHKIQGENTFFVSDQFDETEIKKYAKTVMQHNDLKYCIYGWCELLNNKYKADFRLLAKK